MVYYSNSIPKSREGFIIKCCRDYFSNTEFLDYQRFAYVSFAVLKFEHNIFSTCWAPQTWSRELHNKYKRAISQEKKKVKTITRWEKLLSPNDSSVMDKFITKEELSNLREISDCLSMNFNEVMWKVDDAPVHHWLYITKAFSNGTDTKCQLYFTTDIFRTCFNNTLP